MSNGDLQNRTSRALGASDVEELRALLREWLQEAPLLGNLHRSRALCGRLMDDQKNLIGALQVGIQQAERHPDDGPLQTFREIAIKRIAGSVQVP